jgi:hypothetical protein
MAAASATSSAKSSADLEPATATKHLTDPKMPRLIVAAFSFNCEETSVTGGLLVTFGERGKCWTASNRVYRRSFSCQFSQLVHTNSEAGPWGVVAYI